MEKRDLLDRVRDLAPTLDEAARFIWHHPETGGNEKVSAGFYRDKLAEEGFAIYNEPRLEHAFYAEYGSGSPVIAILGEYDALPGLSQQPTTEKCPVTEGAPGHGCGHNLLGSAAYTAAIAIKRMMQDEGLAGTLRFYGCPEEELLDGKVKMIKCGMFDGCDIALSWHPMDVTCAYDGGYLASISAHFNFHGRTSHAAVAPEKGRSALDAVELMDVGVNYLREHVIQEARIHYTTDSGGFLPNVVPDKAGAWYFVRAPHMADVLEIYERVKKVAEGAAIMTETQMDCTLDYGCWEMREAPLFADLASVNLALADAPSYTPEELEFASNLQATLDPSVVARGKRTYGAAEDEPLFLGAGARELWRKVPLTASTDTGDVSFIMPMCTFTTACWPIGVSPHTWQSSSCAGTTIGEKGALMAAQTFAGIAYDLLSDPAQVQVLKDEFRAGDEGIYHPVLNGFDE